MIECRHCRDVFRQPIDKIGARCPTCRLPLFEKDRHRAPVVDLGPCAVHGGNVAAAKCQRCGKMMCALCRTRWEEEIVCAQCLDQSLRDGASSPSQVRGRKRQAALSLALAIMGWLVLLLALWPLAALFRGSPDRSPATLTLMLYFGSFFFAAFALGQGIASIRDRGPRLAIATCGLSLAGLQLGVCLGLMAINIWHH
jgi:hypothetical protein